MSDKIVGFNINSKGYGIIPKTVMIDTNLNIYSKALYAYFCSYTGSGNTCFPSRKKICYDLGISIDTFSKYLGQLVSYGYVKVEQVKEKGKFSHNIYTLCDTISPCPKRTDTDVTVYGETDTNNNSTKINSISNIISNIHTPLTPQGEESVSEREKAENKEAEEIVDLFNTICVSLSPVKKLNKTRKRKLDNLLFEYDREDFITVFKNAENTPFLSGLSSNSGWRAHFDWLIIEDNFQRVLEGVYSKINNYSQNNNTYNIFDEISEAFWQ